MNWTSTKVPMWQFDCQNYWRAGSAFEVRDVTTEEHMKFVATFASVHELSFSVIGQTARFSAPGFATG
ncbi:MAG TPA: hypothetical protein VM735_13895 [Candidatus Kapabacteria bacterium]|nr:hypothetical protein [Candidatus Kapabacteria bacterium]